MKSYKYIAIIALLMIHCGCQNISKDVLKPSKNQLAHRQIQTRVFQSADEKNILSASAAVLQDMGYNLEESETKLGVITASKKADAMDKAEFGLRTASAILGALSGHVQSNPYQGMAKDQKIRVSLVTSKLAKRKETAVRITFQRVIWDMDGNIISRTTLHKPDIYKQFFAKLSKSVFLEAHQI